MSWQDLCPGAAAGGGGGGHGPRVRAQCEYLRKTLQSGRVYTVKGDDGEFVVFQALELTSKSRIGTAHPMVFLSFQFRNPALGIVS